VRSRGRKAARRVERDTSTGSERPIAAPSALSPDQNRYYVNVLVSQNDKDGPIPIVREFHPTLANLVGSVEYTSQGGFLVTNFQLIKAGAMHRANGGFLLLDARHLLSEPFSWPALKRMLRQREIKIEDVTRFAGLTSTVSLEPDAIPLDLKVIIFGERLLYYLLSAYDPEISEFFKVLADFEDDIDRTPDRGDPRQADCFAPRSGSLKASRSRRHGNRARILRPAC